MCETLFKGKRTDSYEWVEGFLFYQTIDGENACCIGTEPLSANDYSEILGDWYEVIPETVGQFTGKTINGKKLYDGDAIKRTAHCDCFGYPSVHDEKAVVVFDKDNYCYSLSQGIGSALIPFSEWDWDGCTLIDNGCENS